jgi:xylulokinase
VPVDADGAALEPVLQWNDGRERRIVGQPSFFLPKAAWLRAERPDAYEKTQYLLSLPEYVDFLLTGTAITITPTDEFAPYIWDDEQFSAYGVDPARFPPFVHTGERIGAVTSAASRRFGIPAGVPVVAGGSDFLMSLVGTGSLAPGRTCDRAGTSEGINYCSGEHITDPRLRTLPHVRGGLYNIAAILDSTGSVFEWFRAITERTDTGYVELLEEIRGASEDAPLFFPEARSTEGWSFEDGAFLGLKPCHGVPEIGRAVVESLGFGIRHSVEVLAEAGCTVDALRVCGGQAKNPVWNRMKADMSGREVWVPEVEDAELIGNACCGLVGTGEADGLLEASERTVRFKERITPNLEAEAAYAERYERHREMARRLAAV